MRNQSRIKRIFYKNTTLFEEKLMGKPPPDAFSSGPETALMESLLLVWN
jgi:hypothetical protein